MKLVLPVILMLLSSCHKSAVERTAACTALAKGLDKVNVCLDKIVNESRCAPDVVCVWEGYAIARFNFTKNNINTSIDLSTLNGRRVAGLPSSDTTLYGYRVELVSLSYETDPSKKPYAEIKITPQ